MVARRPRATKGLHPKPPKTGRRELNSVERAKIDILHDEGYSVRQIEAKTGFKRSTVHDTIRKVSKRRDRVPLNDITIYQSAPRSGRPQALDDRTKRHILRHVQTENSTRIPDAKEQINDLNLSCSITTLQNVLYQERLGRLEPGKKPALDEDAKALRLQICDGLRGFDWKKRAVFMDAASCCVGQKRGKRRLWRRPEEEFDKDCREYKIPERSCSQFFACFAYGRKGPAAHIPYETEVRLFPY